MKTNDGWSLEIWEGQINRRKNGQTSYRYTDRQTDRQANRYTDRQTDRQANRYSRD